MINSKDLKITEDLFQKDVRHHRMEILLDQGVYRHLKFKQPEDAFLYWFEIITSPGLLTINGNMGTFVFSRMHDMFQFFRSEATEPSFRYIAEKCKAGETRAFNADAAEEAILDRIAECMDKSRNRLTDAEIDEIRSELSLEYVNEEQVMDDLWDNSNDTDLIVGDKTYEGFFEDFYPNFERFTVYFQWCVRAIRWAIEQYDQVKNEQNQNQPKLEGSEGG